MAESDLDYWSDSYQSAVDEISALVATFASQNNGLPDDERDGVVASCESKLQRARGIKKSYALELRLLRDRETKARHEALIRELDERCRAASEAIGKLRAAEARDDLFDGAASTPAPHPGARDETKGNDDYLAAAERTQDQTAESLGRTKYLVEASKEVGQSTLDELQRQEEQLKSIGDDVDRIGDNLGRADRLIKDFTKRMFTDKIIQFFAFLNFVLLTVVIIYVSVTGKGLNNDNSKSKDDNPDE